MASQLVKWTKKRLFNLPEKLSVYGILDKFVLNDVSLDIAKINKELNDHNYPFNLSFGNLAHVEFNLYLTQSQSVVLIQDVLIILCPALDIKNNGRLLKYDLQTIQFKIQKILNQILGKTDMIKETSNNNESNEWMPWNEIIAWLFRYDPNFVIEINHFHLRFEEMDSPYSSLGLVWDSLCIKPGNKFWAFKWPDADDPLSKLTLACDQTPTLQGKAESVTESFSETPENAMNVGKAVFNGSLRNCRIYCKLNKSSWVSKKIFKSIYEERMDSTLPTVHQLISPEALRNRSKWVLDDRCLLLSNCSLEFQFGLRMAESGIEQCEGSRLTIAIIKLLRFQFTPSIVSILTRIYSLLDLIALRKLLRSFKSLSLIEKKNISTPQRRWYLIQKFLPFWISQNPLCESKIFNNTHIIGKQFFISCIRLSLLEFHLKHPKGRFHITSQFPFIRYPFQLLQKSFVLGKDRINSHLSCITFQSIYTPMSYHFSPIPLEEDQTLQANELCSLEDFIMLGVHPPPLGYFFVCTNLYLQNALGSNFHDVANLINSKKVSDIVQWYLLAVREAEEILSYTWYCISKQLSSEQPPAWVIGEHHTFHSYVLKTLRVFFNDFKVIKYLSEIFDKNAKDVQCKTDLFNLCGLVEEATLYERRHIKSKIYFTFSETYKRIVYSNSSVFPKQQPSEKETMVNPWMNLQRNVDKECFTEHDMKSFHMIPFETLMRRVTNDENKKYRLDMLEWDIPKMLRNVTFGILIDTLEISISSNAPQKATPLSYGVRIRALGLEFSCHLKLSFFLVCREMFLLNLCFDREGYIYQPKNNEELDPNKGFLIAAVTCNENLSAFTEKVTALKSCETSQNEPWAVIGSSIPPVIPGDSDSNDESYEARSAECKFSNKTPTFIKHYSDNFISFNALSRSNSNEEDKFLNNLLTNKSKKYWNTLSISCVTSDCLKGIENLKLPLYLDILSVTTDIHLFVRPVFLEEIYELFFQILTSYHAVRQEKCMASEFNKSTPSLRTTHDIITAALHEASWVMKSFSLCHDTKESFTKTSSFWLNRLSRILQILKDLQLTHSNYNMCYKDYILPTLSFEESENINNLHVLIRCVIPPVNVFLFPFTTFSSPTDSCVAELRLSENIFRFATVRRKKKLHIVASSSQFYFTTRSNIQAFSTLIPILYCLILNRVQEVRFFLNHHKQALKWNQNISMCYVTKASVDLYADALTCIHTSLTKRRPSFRTTSTLQLATNLKME